jgi:hypothetical protein
MQTLRRQCWNLTRQQNCAIDCSASAIIPTDVFATRRTRWVFDRELSPVGVIVRRYPAPNYEFTGWLRDRQGLRDFNNEVLKYLYYRAK